MGRKRRRRGLPAWPLGRSDGDRKKAGCAHPFTRACVHKRMRPCAVTKQVLGVTTHFSVVLHLTTEDKGKRGKTKEICRAHYGQSWRISLDLFLVARAAGKCRFFFAFDVAIEIRPSLIALQRRRRRRANQSFFFRHRKSLAEEARRGRRWGWGEKREREQPIRPNFSPGRSFSDRYEYYCISFSLSPAADRLSDLPPISFKTK